MDIHEVFDKTNWPQLRRQKTALVSVIGKAGKEDEALLDGLLCFLDAVQDAASEAGYRAYREEQNGD